MTRGSALFSTRGTAIGCGRVLNPQGPKLTTSSDLEAALANASPRLRPPPTPWVSLGIHAAVALLWLLLLSRSFFADSVLAWSAGLAYIGYDTILIVMVFVATLAILKPPADTKGVGAKLTVGVIIAAHNEATALPITLRALFAQTDQPDSILIADDGSRDATAAVLLQDFGLVQADLWILSPPSATHSGLRWLRLPHGGKARALNAALLAIDTDVVVTVDADTLLDPGAVGALRAAFSDDPRLVAATGILTPVCDRSLPGRFYQWFQTYEYIRNFLSRYTWARMDALLLVSGAFAGFRRKAVLAVGGFDPACMVEDYELIHRLRRHGARKALGWTTGVVGGARAITDAPATTTAFLRQRRRWFCGFLQTQYWYRDMVGDPAYGRLGLVMLPIKAFDTLQPIYGLIAIGLFIAYLGTGRVSLLAPVGAVLAAKIALDFAFQLWSVHLYRRWVDPTTQARLGRSILASLIEPFTFQMMRHLGAALGWVSLLTGDRAWRAQTRAGLVARETRLQEAYPSAPSVTPPMRLD